MKYRKRYLMTAALHSNDVFVYSFKLNGESNLFEVKKLYNIGQDNHRGALR